MKNVVALYSEKENRQLFARVNCDMSDATPFFELTVRRNGVGILDSIINVGVRS